MDIVPFSPISSVHLLHGVPLDNTYKDTLTFSNVTTQYNYFMSKSRYNFESVAPIKMHNTIRLPIASDLVYDCNYVMFANDNFGDRWFYAFITDIKYVGVANCEITFELDVMQTWKFDYTLEESFVVREHVNDDSIGANLVPENLETGEFVCNSIDNFDFSEQYVCALVSKVKSGEDYSTATGRTVNGVYSGLDVIAGIPSSDPASVNYILSEYITDGKEDCIVGVYQYPQFCGDASQTTPVTDMRSITSNLSSLNGYTPKNNKLFTYPYNYITMSNNEGKVSTYQYENFANPSGVYFNIVGVFVTSPCIFVYPANYRGVTHDYDSGMTLTNFPQCAWVGDAFKAWFSQNKGALVMSGLASAGTVAGGAITGNPFAVTSGLMGVAGEIGSIYDHSQTPPQVHGQVNTDCLNSGMGRIKFTFQKMSVKYQFAKIIDDYFTKFGYKVNALKVPNTNTRPSFNYVKTIDCNITGSVPFNDMSKIRGIFDSGVTFWHGDYVGDYSRTNK